MVGDQHNSRFVDLGYYRTKSTKYDILCQTVQRIMCWPEGAIYVRSHATKTRTQNGFGQLQTVGISVSAYFAKVKKKKKKRVNWSLSQITGSYL